MPGFPLLPSTKKGRRLLPASHGAMLSLFYEWGNRAAWITAAIIAVLFFCAVIYAFPNARQVAMQQRDATERENRPSVKSTEGCSGPASTPCVQRTWTTSG